MFYFHANCLQNKRIEWMNGIFGLELDCEVFSHSNWSRKLLDQLVIFFFWVNFRYKLELFHDFLTVFEIWEFPKHARHLTISSLQISSDERFTSFLIRRERTHFSSLNLWILYGMEKVYFNIQFWRFDICRKKWENSSVR